MTETSVAPEPQTIVLPPGQWDQWLIDSVNHHNAGVELYHLAAMERGFDADHALGLSVRAMEHLLTSIGIRLAHAAKP